ncbi:hypothetical protein HL658_17405 [Azospirillum sp. RWY-5-1]|uniref:Uncharacterized protein n=1 Tax=Azospirillum oleiclasticum TaxID=2735135 RepID=A0ABX2TGE6_9PROT|nr:hypothetical protein [Azospirillum oleiclasticum]NYZ14337.1 hypothetical protein [Azospirillum oleiclasticum]NYZ23311.1 hypothetical protein [Azospirillum oleiclasticum]
MMGLSVLGAVTVSAVALVRLARTNPKRRRILGLPQQATHHRPLAAVTMVCAPGLLLLGMEGGPAFTVWLSALTLLGWGVASLGR